MKYSEIEYDCSYICKKLQKSISLFCVTTFEEFSTVSTTELPCVHNNDIILFQNEIKNFKSDDNDIDMNYIKIYNLTQSFSSYFWVYHLQYIDLIKL